MLIIKNTKKYGRGVFSNRNIKRGELIEVSPLIIISKKKESDLIMKTILSKYVYCLGLNQLGIAGGFGSFFNHSQNNNIRWKIDLKNKVIKYYSLKEIKVGEELFLNYGYNPS